VRRTMNRVLLCLVGLILVAVGGSVLVGGFGLPRRHGFRLPSWWPYKGPHDVLLGDHARTRYRAEGWWWPAVIAVLAVLVLIALWWLVAQLRSRRLGRVVVDNGDGGGVTLRGRALEYALAADAEALPGVVRADVRLAGRRAAPVAYFALRLDGDAVPGAVVADLDGQVLADARMSAALPALPAGVLMRGERHRARRVE
jgi:hypothetical protein